jgi:three-Cys-motif partner protein
VDAFAGTGRCYLRDRGRGPDELFSGLTAAESQEAQDYIDGSARIALETQPPFDHYLFVEQDPECARELEKLKQEYADRGSSVEIQVTDANRYLTQWCRDTDWRRNRAVVFLDPYGMEVEWTLIEAIATTQAIDLWILFPLGVAVNRLLKRSEPPPESWASALTRMFGTDQWLSEFYSQRRQITLFGEDEQHVRQADLTAVGQFFVHRLQTVFAGVAENPLPLLNSRNLPLYLLCFAAGNPQGAPIAVRIAQNVLRR